MNIRIRALALACIVGFLPQLHAQTVATRAADYIIALVNSEPITFQELNSEVLRVTKQLAQNQQSAPPAAELRKLVLERMVNDKAQLQWARDTGIKIEPGAIDQAEESVARQNQIDLEQLHKNLAKDGISVDTFRNQLRDQLTLSRLHERDVESIIRVSDVDVDRKILERQSTNTDPLAQDINLSQILVALPEKASGEEAAALFLKARKLLERVRAGEEFDALVQSESAAERKNGGQMGLRRADRYPSLFVSATQDIPVGGVSEVVRSGAGFHILKVVERRAPERLVKTLVQTRARHILIRTGAKVTPAQAVARLSALKTQITSDKVSFVNAAREVSEDSTAAQGGDLGWASPGMFVPEFEETMNKLAEGDISAPLVSRFGVHLIQVVERRRVELNPQQVRESVRNQLRQELYEQTYATWARDLRARAFVEFRDPPL